MQLILPKGRVLNQLSYDFGANDRQMNGGQTGGGATLDKYATIPRNMAPGTSMTVPACPRSGTGRMSPQI